MSTTISLFKIELRKLRHRRVWFLFLAAEAFQGLWMYYSVSRVKEDILLTGYNYLFIFSAMLESILFPLLYAMLASRICDAEHKGGTLKLLYTLEKPRQLFFSKMLVGLLYILLISLAQTAMIPAIMQMTGIIQPLPAARLAFIFAVSLILSAVIFLIQLILSLLIENQLIPLVVGLLGSFLGIFNLYVPQLRPFSIWGYYVLLAPASIDWDQASGVTTYYELPMDFGKLGLITLLGLCLYLAGRQFFTGKEV